MSTSANSSSSSSSELASSGQKVKKLDKEKYLRILASDGLNAAVTQLHKDMWEIEFECFEGPKGYQPQIFEDLKDFRQFSVELWDQTREPGLKP